jgi:hypothetical protein
MDVESSAPKYYRLDSGGITAMLARLLLVWMLVVPCFAGSIFLTGHDPDYHASLGDHAEGAVKLNTTAINFILDPVFNPFVSTAPKFLFVESAMAIPFGHTRGVDGMVASGLTLGVDFDWVTAAGLHAALNGLGTVYSGLVIASDFGGTLTQAELNILNARSADIIRFLNAGGGLYASSESNLVGRLTPGGGHFGFLPFVVTAPSLSQEEIGFSVTDFGASLGLTAHDVNGNVSHNIFPESFGLQAIDLDAQGNIVTLAGRGPISDDGVVPEPASFILMLTGVGVLAAVRRKQRRSTR